jgi:hypothetical protein
VQAGVPYNRFQSPSAVVRMKEGVQGRRRASDDRGLLFRCGWAKALLFGLLTICVISSAAGSASAAETHFFDATLSLTGNCTTEAVDPVPDPPVADCSEGPHPAGGGFDLPHAVATDFYGNIYVITGREGEGSVGHIDIFDSDGFFVTEIVDPRGPKSLAVDSKGNLYVFESLGAAESQVVRFEPTTYDGAAGEIGYGEPPATAVKTNEGSFLVGLAINVENDHLFVYAAKRIKEFGSAEEGNKLLDGSTGEGELINEHGLGLAIDAAHGVIYASDREPEGSGPYVGVVKVFDLEQPHVFLGTITGSATSSGNFSNGISLAVDESSGHLFVYDEKAKAAYEFTPDGTLVSTIEHSFKTSSVVGPEIGIDNGPFSPNGGLDKAGRYLYVPSQGTKVGHSFAFGPELVQCPPKVEGTSLGEVTEDEADLRALINPCNASTSYVFEYTTTQRFQEEGFVGALVAGAGQLPVEGTPIEVFASTLGLLPDTAYRFRVVATNGKGSDEAEGSFVTYPPGVGSESCPNSLFRTSFSASLPDCRAYELVTPPATNARTPEGVRGLGSAYFATREASPAGGTVSWLIEGGTLPSEEGTGSLAGDPYLSVRGPSGWTTSPAGPTGVEATTALPGSNSPDQGYSFWAAGPEGTASIEGKTTEYVRYPDGHSELVGRGSLGNDTQADGNLITEHGEHIIFTSRSVKRLEPQSPPPFEREENGKVIVQGTQAVYDRTADGVTHVVSLLPGDVVPAAREPAAYNGASPDGQGIAFEMGSTLYLRYDNLKTYEVAEEASFAGVAEGGGRIFYVEDGDLYAFDVATESVTPLTSSGDVTVVNVATSGTAAYFVSPSVLSGGNPNEAKPKKGKQNLYLWDEGSLSFVGTVTDRDVEGHTSGQTKIEGLGLWTEAVSSGKVAADPSRAAPNGRALLFESRAALTAYASDGHTEIYRYDADENALQCVSCSPVGKPAADDASLQSISPAEFGAAEPFSAFALVLNLRADGRRAFFQSTEPLVAADSDGLQDVYEWEADGVGSCDRGEGCVYLISSGQSNQKDYLYAVSDSGDDVFFRSGDLLVPSDLEETQSIYDARVNGGFPEGTEAECQGEGCRPGFGSPPSLGMPGTPAPGAHDNVGHAKPCPKGKRRVKRHGKMRCIKRHHKHGTKGKGAGK